MEYVLEKRADVPKDPVISVNYNSRGEIEFTVFGKNMRGGSFPQYVATVSVDGKYVAGTENCTLDDESPTSMSNIRSPTDFRSIMDHRFGKEKFESIMVDPNLPPEFRTVFDAL